MKTILIAVMVLFSSVSFAVSEDFKQRIESLNTQVETKIQKGRKKLVNLRRRFLRSSGAISRNMDLSDERVIVELISSGSFRRGILKNFDKNDARIERVLRRLRASYEHFQDQALELESDLLNAEECSSNERDVIISGLKEKLSQMEVLTNEFSELDQTIHSLLETVLDREIQILNEKNDLRALNASIKKQVTRKGPHKRDK